MRILPAVALDVDGLDFTVLDAAATIRILLVDDHAIICAGLRMLIEARAGFKVIDGCNDHAQCIAAAAVELPDIILWRLDLLEESRLGFLSELLQVTQGKSRIIVLTGDDDPQRHDRAIHHGALGLVLQNRAPEVLLQAIEKVHQGEVWLDRNAMATALTRIWKSQQPAPIDLEAEKNASLTPREREVIHLVARGLKNQQIGSILFISEATVRRHLGAIFIKLDVTDRLELLVYAIQHGIVTVPSRD